MKKNILNLVVLASILAGASPLAAKEKRLSPHETLKSVVDGDKITVTYGRPHTKDPKTGEMRKIWGGLVPFDKVWRTGADEATTITIKRTLVLNGTEIPAGTYTLYTLPAADGSAKLIVNKQTGQWGTNYDQSKDLARIDLKKDALDKPIDQFTMAVEKSPSGGGDLTLAWESTKYSAPFTVKK
jgi:hypothetical protein